MKFLIDNALAPQVAAGLLALGHNAVHVRDYALSAASDLDVFKRAKDEGRIIVSADTDFGTLLAVHSAVSPSVILFRRTLNRRPAQQVALLADNLPKIADALERGSVVVFEEARIRIRNLPIARDG